MNFDTPSEQARLGYEGALKVALERKLKANARREAREVAHKGAGRSHRRKGRKPRQPGGNK